MSCKGGDETAERHSVHEEEWITENSLGERCRRRHKRKNGYFCIDTGSRWIS